MHQRYGRRLPLTQEQGYFLALLSWLVPTITVILAMVVHLAQGARTFPIFISETDYPGPQRVIFTMGLIISGILQMMYSWHLYHEISPEKSRLWNASCVVGLGAGIHVIFIAIYDMYDHINPHIYASMVAFGGGLLWAIMGHIALDSSSSPGANMRKIGITVSMISLIVMITSFQYAVSTFDGTGLTTEQFLNQAQTGINFAGPAEYFLVGGLMVALASFRRDLMERDDASPEIQGETKQSLK